MIKHIGVCPSGRDHGGLSVVAACFLSVAAFGAGASDSTIPLALPPESLPDPADLIRWPVASYPVFASNSAGHLGSWLLDAPAGKHGIVRAKPDGSLVFADGTPARFWGTATVYGMTFPDKRVEVPLLADAIAARGYNLVRFHHNDEPWRGIGFAGQKPGSNARVDPEMMDRLDYFASELIKRGVYLYVDLVDSRALTEDDGLFEEFPDMKGKGEGWKGLFPHPRIAESWKRAATAFLSHTNQYTGRTWADEPAVVTVETINENGVFWDWSFKVSDSVVRWYDRAWNQWLVKTYGTREKLDESWTDGQGVHGLFPDEDPLSGTVFRPRLMPLLDWDRPYRSKTRGAARVNDYFAFLAESATTFYNVAQQHLRSLGYKGLIVGSHELQGPLNQQVETTTGTLSAHLYGRALPAWFARPTSSGSTVDGVDVKTENWFSNLPRIKAAGLPSINGEWAAGNLTCRADANVSLAAAMAFQGVDQSLHFSYGHRWTGVRMPDYDSLFDYKQYLKSIDMTFTYAHDIPWMVANRFCAALFIRGDFRTPRYTVEMAYSEEDLHEQNLHALGINGGNGTIGNAALFLPLLHDVESRFFNNVYEGDADVVFMTGRSATGDYHKAKHAVLVGDNPFTDRYHKRRDLGHPARLVRPGVKIEDLKQPVTFTVEWPYADACALSFPSFEAAIRFDSIPKGAKAIGRSADGRYTMGWLDDRYLVLPNGRAFDSRIQDRRWLYRLYLEACRRWDIDVADNSIDAAFFRSDTRELCVDWGNGVLEVDTPRSQGFAGLVGWRPRNRTTNLECTLENPYGNVLLTSVDGQPLTKSRRMLLVAVGRMQNTDAVIQTNAAGKAKLVKVGKGPCWVEALRGRLTLRVGRPETLVVYALDYEGRRLGKVDVQGSMGGMRLDLSPRWQTVWFEIVDPAVEAAIAPTPSAWPAPVAERSAPFPSAERVPVPDVLRGSAQPLGKSGEKTADTNAEVRVSLSTFARNDHVGKFGNIKLSMVPDPDYQQVLNAQFGKVTQEWAGGWWRSLPSAGGLPADAVRAFGFKFRGDGTLPRDFIITVILRNGAAYKTAKNWNTIFEQDVWRDVLLPAEAFILDPEYVKKNPSAAASLPAQPNLAEVERVNMVCVGPLMERQSIGRFAEIFLIAKRVPDVVVKDVRKNLPEPKPANAVSIAIPFVSNAGIRPDGMPEEAAWAKSLALAMDEARVPQWQYFGSHVVGGKRMNQEGAAFWLLGTPEGLAILSEVEKGNVPLTAERENWYDNDAVEVFSDPAASGGKPFAQVFLAYRTARADFAAASHPSIKVGRVRTERGYALEALIPWWVLGFKDVPTNEFGLEFQVDFAAPGAGRILQMVYGTGTNEAWISAKHYLRVKLSR